MFVRRNPAAKRIREMIATHRIGTGGLPMYLDNVRQQYERYPYPPRDPRQERQRLLEVLIDRLATINFYCFGGAHDFKGARVLVAGGGTGDSTIYLAEQLRSRGGEVVYLDISQASMDIAQQRAAARKLDNITWRHGSIYALSPEAIGRFDYISCTGVLHHLEDPLEGLKRLKAVLKPTGGMGILVYGKYGRAGIYQFQQLMRLINGSETDLTEKIDLTRRVLAELPASAWFRHNERYLSDHRNLGDSGLVDLLLHEQDVAYSIDEVYQLVGAAGLHLIEFSEVQMRLAYEPEQYLRDKALRERLAKLDRVTRQATAELLLGLFTRHVFYVSNQPEAKAQLGALSDVPFFFPPRTYRAMGQQIADAMMQNPQRRVPLRHESGLELFLAPSPAVAAILRHIDGLRDWRAIFALARGEGVSFSDEQFMDAIRPVYEQLARYDWLLLRGGAVDEYPDTIELQRESVQR